MKGNYGIKKLYGGAGRGYGGGGRICLVPIMPSSPGPAWAPVVVLLDSCFLHFQLNIDFNEVDTVI